MPFPPASPQKEIVVLFLCKGNLEKYHEICESQFRSWLSLVETNFYPQKTGLYRNPCGAPQNHTEPPVKEVPRDAQELVGTLHGASFAAFLLTHFKKSLALFADTKVGKIAKNMNPKQNQLKIQRSDRG